jgi:hypothetical protein
MPRAQLRLQAGAERGFLHTFVHVVELRVTIADTGPDDVRPALRRKRAHTLYGHEEGGEADGRELLAQRLLGDRADVTKEADGEVNLLGFEPANAWQLRVEVDEQARDRFRHVDGDEETFAGHDSLMDAAAAGLVVAFGCAIGQAREPLGREFVRPALAAGAQRVA